MRGFIQIFKMDMRNLFKNPVLIGYNTIFTLLMVLIMGFLTSGAYADISNAYDYYVVSFLIYAMLNGAMTATNCFMERDIKKPNLRIIYSPVGSFPIYFSKILASALFDFVCHLLIFAILIPALQLHFSSGMLGYILLLMAPIEFASSALGVLFCCIFKTEETASTLLSMAISILAVLGGTFFSFDGLGGTLAFLSRLSPMKWITDSFFAILFDANPASFLPLLIGSVALSALLVFGCSKLFRTEDYI